MLLINVDMWSAMANEQYPAAQVLSTMVNRLLIHTLPILGA